MNRLKNIVVAVDFSACSNGALIQAVRMARWNNARLHALHVIDALAVTDFADAFHVPLEEVRQQAVHVAAHELCCWLEEAGGEAESSVVLGAPIDEILQKVRGVSADLLVAGARGESTADQSVGTLAAKCLRKSPSKVMLVGDRNAPPFRTVVACVDFSDTSREVVQQALRVASQDGSEVHLLHVYDPPWRRLRYRAPAPEVAPDFQKQHQAALQTRLEEFVGQHEGFNLRCTLFAHASYGQGIAEYARQVAADLIILGTRGRTNLRYVLLGSTAERLLKDVPCTVLTVRAVEPATAEASSPRKGT